MPNLCLFIYFVDAICWHDHWYHSHIGARVFNSVFLLHTESQHCGGDMHILSLHGESVHYPPVVADKK